MKRAYEYMLAAKEAGEYSNCRRRKIGCVVRGTSGYMSMGFNKTPEPCELCTRNRGYCRAIHAEVRALANTRYLGADGDLYIWSEIPCHQCLSFIKSYSKVTRIHCLTTTSYRKVYLNICTEEVAQRREYATMLGFTVFEYDMEEILQGAQTYESNSSTGS